MILLRLVVVVRKHRRGLRRVTRKEALPTTKRKEARVTQTLTTNNSRRAVPNSSLVASVTRSRR